MGALRRHRRCCVPWSYSCCFYNIIYDNIVKRRQAASAAAAATAAEAEAVAAAAAAEIAAAAAEAARYNDRKKKIEQHRPQLLEALDSHDVTISLYCAQAMSYSQLQRIIQKGETDQIQRVSLINWLEENCANENVWNAFLQGLREAIQWEQLGKYFAD